MNYLFIDGGYLRKTLEDTSKEIFDEDTLELNYALFADSFDKVFYYDCLPPKKNKEDETEYRARIDPIEEQFEKLKEIDNFHVHLGTTAGVAKRSRQKQVDVLIAVHMFQHAVRNNMKKCTLLSGDLDFKPIVDALILEGMFVNIWCCKKTSSGKLRNSADSTEYLTLGDLWRMTTDSFKSRFPVPGAFSIPGVDKKHYKLVKEGTSSLSGEAYMLKSSKDEYVIAYRDFVNVDYFTHVLHRDLRLLEKYLEIEKKINFNWS